MTFFQNSYLNPYYAMMAQNYNPRFGQSLLVHTPYNQNNENVQVQNKPLYMASMDKLHKNNESNTCKKIGAAIFAGVSIATLIALFSDIWSLRSGCSPRNSKLFNLAKARVEHNVVKRKNLSLDAVTSDINKAIQNNIVKKGEKVSLIKASELAKFRSDDHNIGRLGLKDSSMILADGKNNILKIYDTAKMGDDLQLLFGKNPRVQINC